MRAFDRNVSQPHHIDARVTTMQRKAKAKQKQRIKYPVITQRNVHVCLLSLPQVLSPYGIHIPDPPHTSHARPVAPGW